MTILDRALAILALVAFALYVGFLIWRVPQPALVIVCVGGVLLAAFDFARSAFLHNRVDRWNRRANGG